MYGEIGVATYRRRMRRCQKFARSSANREYSSSLEGVSGPVFLYQHLLCTHVLVSSQVSKAFCAIRMPNTVKNVLPNRLPKRVPPVQRSSTITFSSERYRALQCVETRYTLQGSHLVPNKYRVRKKNFGKTRRVEVLDTQI